MLTATSHLFFLEHGVYDTGLAAAGCLFGEPLWVSSAASPVGLLNWGCYGARVCAPRLPMHAPDLDAAHVTVHGVCVQMYLQTEH